MKNKEKCAVCGEKDHSKGQTHRFMPKKTEKRKCIKCGLRYKDRKDPADIYLDIPQVTASLCWNCRHIWKCLEMVVASFAYNSFMTKQLNREVWLCLDDVHIKRRPSQGKGKKKLK